MEQPLAGEKRGIPLGEYMLGPRLAVGGMGEVYLAVRVTPGKSQEPVALKLLLPHLSENEQAIQMFLDEAHVAARMRHPNVVRILDVGMADGRHYISMELVRGVSMSAVIRALKDSRSRLSPELLTYVGRALCDGLHHAHEQVGLDGTRLQVVHRDVTPHNVLLSVQGDVKLTDFGIAKARDSVTHTRPGFVKGKSEYVAPELLFGATLDRRVDIFGAGVTLFHLATLGSPFRRENQMATLQAIEREPLPSLSLARPDLPLAFQDAITRATQKDPGARFPTALALRDALPPAPPEAQQELAELVSTMCKDAVERLEMNTAHALSLRTDALSARRPGTASLGPLAPEPREATRLDRVSRTRKKWEPDSTNPLPPEQEEEPDFTNPLPLHREEPDSTHQIALPPEEEPASIDQAPLLQQEEEPASIDQASLPPEEEPPLADHASLPPEEEEPPTARERRRGGESTLKVREKRPAARHGETTTAPEPRGGRFRRIGLLLAALLVCGGGVYVAARALRPSSAPVAVEPTPVPAPAPPVVPASTPPADDILAELSDPSPPPVEQASTEVKPEDEGVQPTLESVPVVAPNASPAPSTAEAPNQEENAREAKAVSRVGYLTVDAIPWARVYLKGRLIGETPISRYPVAEGRVVVELRNPETGKTVKRRARIHRGKTIHLKENLR